MTYIRYLHFSMDFPISITLVMTNGLLLKIAEIVDLPIQNGDVP